LESSLLLFVFFLNDPSICITHEIDTIGEPAALMHKMGVLSVTESGIILLATQTDRWLSFERRWLNEDLSDNHNVLDMLHY